MIVAGAVALLIIEGLAVAVPAYKLLRWKRPPESPRFALTVAGGMFAPFVAYGLLRIARVLY